MMPKLMTDTGDAGSNPRVYGFFNGFPRLDVAIILIIAL